MQSFFLEVGPSHLGCVRGPQLQFCLLVPAGISQAESHCFPFCFILSEKNSLVTLPQHSTSSVLPPSSSEFLNPQVLSCLGYFPVPSNIGVFVPYPAVTVLHDRSFIQTGWVCLFKCLVLVPVRFYRNRMSPLQLFLRISVVSVLEV